MPWPTQSPATCATIVCGAHCALLCIESLQPPCCVPTWRKWCHGKNKHLTESRFHAECAHKSAMFASAFGGEEVEGLTEAPGHGCWARERHACRLMFWIVFGGTVLTICLGSAALGLLMAFKPRIPIDIHLPVLFTLHTPDTIYVEVRVV
jgi:hypothetical protein